MGKCRVLYARPESDRPARSDVELHYDELTVRYPDGRIELVRLSGAHYEVRDAACRQRFVRYLTLEHRDGAVEMITPPEQGAIAPRAARLPVVSEGSVIVEAKAFEAVVDWITGGGLRAARTVRELARLIEISSPTFAIALGVRVARIAEELSWERRGPMRSGIGLRHLLRPLEEAARTSPRAADAPVAALSQMADG